MKGAATDSLRPPRHIFTLPVVALQTESKEIIPSTRTFDPSGHS